VAKHAVVVGPAAAAISVPNLISSKHERAARAQAKTELLKHKPSEMFENLDAGKAKSAELAKIVEAQKTHVSDYAHALSTQRTAVDHVSRDKGLLQYRLY
jgi:hypothetical protein